MDILILGQIHAHLCDVEYTDHRRRVEQVIQRAQFSSVVNVYGHRRRSAISRYVVVKQPIKQALWKYGVHGLSNTERHGYEREHGKNVRDLEGR